MKDKNGVRVHLVDPVKFVESDITGYIMQIHDNNVTVDITGGGSVIAETSNLEIQISKGNAIKRKIRDNRIYHAEIESKWNGLTDENSNIEMRQHHRPGEKQEEWFLCKRPTFFWKVFEYRVKV